MSDRTIRALQRGWAAGIVLAVLLPVAALVWTHLDRRPAWVIAVIVQAESRDPVRARNEERAAVAAVLRHIERVHVASVALRGEVERRTGNGSTYLAERTLIVRDEREELLSRLERDTGSPAASATTARRALRAPDTAFAFALMAMLLSLSTLEPSALSDADPFSLSPPLVVLNLAAVGLLGAGAVVVAGGWNLLLAFAVIVTLGPVMMWLARSRSRWTLEPRLNVPYLAIACVTGAAVVAWIARLAR